MASPAKHPPMLMEGPLTKAVYIVTRYKIVDAERGIFQAQIKYDVTEQFNALVASRSLSGEEGTAE